MSLKYEVKTWEYGTEPQFYIQGPWLNTSGLFMNKDINIVKQVASLLNQAYEAGLKDKSEQILNALGLSSTPWGIKQV